MRRRAKINNKEKKTDNKVLKKTRTSKGKKYNKASKRKTDFKFKISKSNIRTIVVLFLLIIMYNIFKNYHRYGLSLEKNITSNQAIQIETVNSNNIIKEYGRNILVYNSGKIAVYNRFGVKKWETKLDEMFSVSINTIGKYIQVLNKDSGYVYVYSGKYEVSRIKVDGKIRSCKISKDGTSIIEHDSVGAKSILSVFGKNGKLLYEIKLNNNIIGEYTLSNNSRYLAYVDVDIQGISLNSNINVIDLNKVKEEDYKIKTISTNNTSLVYKLIWKSSNLIIQLDDEILKYTTLNDKLYRYGVEEKSLLNISVYNFNLAFTSPIANDTGYELNLSKLGSKRIKEVSILDAPKYFIYDYGLVYICYQKGISIYNKLGIKIKEYKSDNIISKPVIFNDGKSVAIPISNRIILFTI